MARRKPLRPVRATDVEAENVTFLWNGRIPEGMISVVAGQPDKGKGLFAARVAADVSRAGGTVLYSAAEDSAGLMTRPRLEVAGADLDRVLLWEFQLPAHMSELAAIVMDEEVKLIVMDPFASHLSHGISRHSDNVRQVLGPLKDLCDATGVAILIVEHVNKRVPKNGHPLMAIGGTGSGLPAAARAAYVFGIHPEDDEQRVLCMAKFNIGPTPKPLAFTVDSDFTEHGVDAPFLEIEDELPGFNAMRLFEEPGKEGANGRPPEKRAAASEWLTTRLMDGPALASLIIEDAKQVGMTGKTLRRAADDMEIVRNPPGGGRNCTWDLPPELKEALGLNEPPALKDLPAEDMVLGDDDIARLLGEQGS